MSKRARIAKKKAKRDLASIRKRLKARGVSRELRKAIEEESRLFLGLKPIAFHPTFLADQGPCWEARYLGYWTVPFVDNLKCILAD